MIRAELVHLEPRFWKLFDFMQRQAANWDGAEPIRQVPDESEWLAAGESHLPQTEPGQRFDSSPISN